MTDNSSFIDEVTEEVRRDRLFALFRRYGWIAAVIILLIVGGAAWNEYRKAQERASAEALGDSILSALESDDEAQQAAALGDISAGDNPRAQALVAMIAAASGEDPADLDALWAIAENPDVPALWRDVAALKAAIASSGTMASEDLIARLEPLAVPGAPYRLLALEQIAVAELSRGETPVALELLREIIADDAAGQGLRQRAEQLIVALGGDLTPT